MSTMEKLNIRINNQNKKNLFYAVYRESSTTILVFSTEDERDDYVYYEYVVHPDISAVQYDEISYLIKDKPIVYDMSFGCMRVSYDD